MKPDDLLKATSLLEAPFLDGVGDTLFPIGTILVSKYHPDGDGVPRYCLVAKAQALPGGDHEYVTYFPFPASRGHKGIGHAGGLNGGPFNDRSGHWHISQHDILGVIKEQKEFDDESYKEAFI